MKKKKQDSIAKQVAKNSTSVVHTQVSLELFEPGETPKEGVTKRVIAQWHLSSAADKPFYTPAQLPGDLKVNLLVESGNQVVRNDKTVEELTEGFFVSVDWIARSLREKDQKKALEERKSHLEVMCDAVSHKYMLPHPVLMLLPHSKDLPFPYVVNLEPSDEELILRNPHRQNPVVADLMRVGEDSAARATDRVMDTHPGTYTMFSRMKKFFLCPVNTAILPASLIQLVKDRELATGVPALKYPDELFAAKVGNPKAAAGSAEALGEEVLKTTELLEKDLGMFSSQFREHTKRADRLIFSAAKQKKRTASPARDAKRSRMSRGMMSDDDYDEDEDM